MLTDQRDSLLEQIWRAFSRGDEDLGHELIAQAIERHEMPAEVVARAMSAGLEAWRPNPISTR